MIPVVSIVGKSNSGKTTLIVHLIKELKARGYRVGTIKHHHHTRHFDQPGKDTYEHYDAGAEKVIIASPVGFAVYTRLQREKTLDELLAYQDDVDIVLLEGFKSRNKPKIEVVRRERSTEMICDNDEICAVVSDMTFDTGKPNFSLDDYRGVADFIVYNFVEKASVGQDSLPAGGSS